MVKVLVTGGNGQVGQALRLAAQDFPQLDLRFFSSSELDITDASRIRAVFDEVQPDFCINTAAYTAVDKAESEPEKARLINSEGPRKLARACREHDTVLLHISTDFVFDGTKESPYTEDDVPNPQSVYGATKLDGERAIAEEWENHFIVRTSWVYSQFGNNFMKTMLRLASERDRLSVVADQTGTPTNANDLAKALLTMVTQHTTQPYGIYHFSNEGSCSWYEFAVKIMAFAGRNLPIDPIATAAYPTPAKRPAYSVLSKDKIVSVFRLPVRDWQESLGEVVKGLS